MGYGRFPDATYSVKVLEVACYPPRSDTSQDERLVDLLESQKLHVLFLNMNILMKYCTRVVLYSSQMEDLSKEMLLRRQRTQYVLYMHLILFKSL